MEFLNSVWTNLMVVFGLGFVIFIHELGHFLLAKWNGVKVEKFAIGFDIKGLKLYSKTVGETEYVLGAIPLGGYVKMLGEEPPPAGEDPDAGPVMSRDPRAYHNRPVGARMAIITAGVLMNLLFGLLCFTYVYMRGKPDQPPVIGSVEAGRPGYLAGLRPNDRIVAVDGNPVESFSQIIQATVFSGPKQVLHLDVLRDGADAPVRVEVMPRKLEGGIAPSLGISSAAGLELDPDRPYVPPAGGESKDSTPGQPLIGGRAIVAAGPAGAPLEPVETRADFDRIAAAHRQTPLVVEAEWSPDATAQDGPKSVTATIPPSRFLDLGLRLDAGPIVAVRPGSPAEDAGLRRGERIVGVVGVDEYDPMKLPDLAYDRALAGETLELEVEATPAEAGASPRRRTVAIRPDATTPWTEERVGQAEPLEVPGLGLAFAVVPVVRGVRPGSPAEAVGVQEGDRLLALTINAAPRGAKKPDRQRIEVGSGRETDPAASASWPFLFDSLQALPLRPIELSIARGAIGSEKERTLNFDVTLAPDDEWYTPGRGLAFLSLTTITPPMALPSALRSGFDETVDNVTSVYYMIRGLIQRRLGADAVGGPIPIFDMGRKMASLGLDAFLPFLGMLSVNLAVINFLPIPPLDGGQFFLLLAEKLRGRPLPDRYVGPITFAGLVLLLALILVVNLKDVFNLF